MSKETGERTCDDEDCLQGSGSSAITEIFTSTTVKGMFSLNIHFYIIMLGLSWNRVVRLKNHFSILFWNGIVLTIYIFEGLRKSIQIHGNPSIKEQSTAATETCVITYYSNIMQHKSNEFFTYRSARFLDVFLKCSHTARTRSLYCTYKVDPGPHDSLCYNIMPMFIILKSHHTGYRFGEGFHPLNLPCLPPLSSSR